MKTKLLVRRRALWSIAASIFAGLVVAVLGGCQSASPVYSSNSDALAGQSTNDIILKPGDVVRIAFPSGAKLDDSEQTIRADGKLTLPVIGEVLASGDTPEQFRRELEKKFSKEIVSSQNISVVVVSTSFRVYVVGAVLHPGRVTADHRLTTLNAIMEAGGYDSAKAQLNSVRVVRIQNGSAQTFFVNLEGVEKPGEPVENFDLHPSDIVIVPQKTVIF